MPKVSLLPIINFLSFHGAWWLIILLALYQPYGYPFMLMAVCLINMVVHLKYIEKQPTKELLFLSIAFLIGISTETLLINILVLRYELIPTLEFRFPPYWILALWAVFPLSIGHSLSFLYKLRLPGMLLGAALTTLTYRVGERLDLLYFSEPNFNSMAYFCGVWFVLLVVLFKLREQIHKSALI